MRKITPETAEKSAIKDYLDIMHWFHFPLTAGLGSYPGAPDMMAIKGGQVLAIEVKAGRNKQSEHQKRFQSDWEGKGGTYICGGLDEVMAVIKNL